MAAETVPPVAPAGPPRATPPGVPARRPAAFAAHLSWNVASDLAARGASLWVSFYGARVLAVAEYGQFAWALAVAQTAWLAGDALLNSGYATRELARRVHDADARGAADVFWQARLTSGAALSLALAAAAAWAPLPPGARPALFASAIYGLAYAAYPDWALRAVSDFRALLLANAAYAGTLVAATLVWLPRHPHAADAAVLWSASFGAAAVVGLTALARRGLWTGTPRLTPAAWAPHVRRSVVFSLGALAGIGSVQLPLLLCGALAPAHEAGLFAAAYRLLLVPLGAFSVLWWPLFPMLVRATPGSRTHHELVARAAALAAAAAWPTALGLAWFAEPLVVRLFGAGYAAAAPALRLGALALPAYAACGLLEQVALAAGGEAARVRVYGLSAAVIAGTALVTLPTLGGRGAALALTAGFGAAALSWAFVLRAVLPWRALAHRLAPVAGALALLAAAWLGLARTPVPPLVQLVAGATGFAALLFATGGLRLPSVGAPA